MGNDFFEYESQRKLRALTLQKLVKGEIGYFDDVDQFLTESERQALGLTISRFHGFSSMQMNLMVNFPLEPGCPVQLRHLTDEQIAQIPIMRQVIHLMKTLKDKELKLTSKGNLPPKIVEELYNMGTHSWLSDWYKRRTEDNTEEVIVVRYTLKECGLIKTRSGKMSLTAKGERKLMDLNKLMYSVVYFLFKHYHTGWMDGYEEPKPGNVGRLYSLWLLHHFGNEWRSTAFYSREYYTAFPDLGYSTAYVRRIFDRLFRLIGLCEAKDCLEERTSHLDGSDIRKTPILEMMFSFQEPAKR